MDDPRSRSRPERLWKRAVAIAALAVGAAGLIVWTGSTLGRRAPDGAGEPPDVSPPSQSPPSQSPPSQSPPSRSTTARSTTAVPAAVPPSSADRDVPGTEPPPVIAWYFHRTVRCHACLAIEEVAWRTIETDFLAALGEGTLRWRPVNLDEAENARFAKDFDLSAQSLVLAKVEKGETVEWKNLTEVWKLVDDPAALGRYIRDEVARYLGSP